MNSAHDLLGLLFGKQRKSGSLAQFIHACIHSFSKHFNYILNSKTRGRESIDSKMNKTVSLSSSKLHLSGNNSDLIDYDTVGVCNGCVMNGTQGEQTRSY